MTVRNGLQQWTPSSRLGGVISKHFIYLIETSMCFAVLILQYQQERIEKNEEKKRDLSNRGVKSLKFLHISWNQSFIVLHLNQSHQSLNYLMPKRFSAPFPLK